MYLVPRDVQNHKTTGLRTSNLAHVLELLHDGGGKQLVHLLVLDKEPVVDLVSAKREREEGGREGQTNPIITLENDTLALDL